MSEKKAISEPDWVRTQVQKFKAVHGRYEQHAVVLEKVLRSFIKKHAPEAIVQVRTKAISSFAEKIQRKRAEYKDAINDMTDLCGGRVILTTPSEVEALCKFIEGHFDIDWENSIDVRQRHKPAEFGYRSVHYIVSFRKGVFPTREVEASIPRQVLPDAKCPMKAEVQVRTFLEHAWAVFAHDRTYKSSFKIPYKWQRELAGVAAVLEDADKAFERIQSGLRMYASSYSVYMKAEQIKAEIEKLEFILSYNPGNVELATRIGQLAIENGDWQKVIDVLTPYADSEHQPALKTLGIALYKKHDSAPNSRDYKRGQKYLEAAMALDKDDVEAAASLAGSWNGVDDDKAGELYRRAFEIDPVVPYPLVNHLIYEISKKKDASIALTMVPVINSSIKRCQDQVEVGANLPWAYYSMGFFHLLTKRPYESVSAYARAIQLSAGKFMIDTSIESLSRLSAVREALSGYEWIRRLLILGRAARFPDEGMLKEVTRLAAKGHDKIQGPVVILAGGCDPGVEEIVQAYEDILIEAFRGFRGTIISGGTTQGISGLAGRLAKKYKDGIHTIGYLPKMVPADATVDKDRLRYKEIRYSEGSGFTPLEPLQNWIDLLYSGIEPSQVKVLGINGGQIASIEYKIALALGARVALIEGSGREASKLLSDADWIGAEGLITMPADAQTIGMFIRPCLPMKELGKRETMAKAFHERYRKIHTAEALCKDPSMAKWDNLEESLRESNLQEADHISDKLRRIGCEVFEVKGRKVSLFTLSKKEIEIMAEMEHGRWNAERLTAGWKRGEKNVEKKISPYLVSWSELPEDIKEWDRVMVREIPAILSGFGLEIRRKKA